jgi:hypothetical protein
MAMQQGCSGYSRPATERGSNGGYSFYFTVRVDNKTNPVIVGFKKEKGDLQRRLR